MNKIEILKPNELRQQLIELLEKKTVCEVLSKKEDNFCLNAIEKLQETDKKCWLCGARHKKAAAVLEHICRNHLRMLYNHGAD